MSVDLASIVLRVSVIQTTRIAQATAFLFYVYDFATNVRQEVNMIWTLRWTLPKTLFMIIRYYGTLTLFLDLLMAYVIPGSSSSCVYWLAFSSANHTVFLGIFVNLLFLLRLRALYGQRLHITAILGALFLTELSLNLAMVFKVPPKAIPTSDFVGALDGCIDGAWAGGLMIATQGVCLFRSVLYLSFALYKWNEYVVVGEIKEAAAANRIVRRTHAGRRLSPLLALFVRDESAVFLILTCLQTVAAIFAMVPKLRLYGGVVFQWFMSAMAICSLHLVLNLHLYFDSTSNATRMSVDIRSVPNEAAVLDLRPAANSLSYDTLPSTPSTGKHV